MKVEQAPDRLVGDYEWALASEGPLSASQLSRRLGVKLARCERSLKILKGLGSVRKDANGRWDIDDPITRDGGRHP